MEPTAGREPARDSRSVKRNTTSTRTASSSRRLGRRHGAYYVAMRDTTPYASFLPLNGHILVLAEPTGMAPAICS